MILLAANVSHELWRALSFAFGMTWEVLWALILGFGLSAVVQAVVSKREMRKLLPDDSPKTLRGSENYQDNADTDGEHTDL